MKAFIFAAGRGERMGVLTQNTPKPLLKVHHQTLLENKIVSLKAAGVTDIIINVAYLGEQIQTFAGAGDKWGVNIQYSKEPQPLETGGGLAHALPLLGENEFVVINADIWCDYPLSQIIEKNLKQNCLGHLVMVDNPPHHPEGDFSLQKNGLLQLNGEGKRLTFSGIARYHPDLIREYPKVRTIFPLVEAFHFFMDSKRLSAEYYGGYWNDIGTPDRLESINELFGDSH